ncbi:MAG: type III-B CRISPR module-associated protein Cmr5 [bacterium]|nr:type III-B CRISPR module-associated protein Cmr5 [bacterium]
MRNPKIIEQYFSKANDALIKSGIVIRKLDGTYEPIIGEYEGYIAGFGATVINMGIKPAVAAYCANPPSKPDKPSKKKIIKAIALTLGRQMVNNIEVEDKLLDDLISNNDIEVIKELKENIVNASVALKIILRTFSIDKA